MQKLEKADPVTKAYFGWQAYFDSMTPEQTLSVKQEAYIPLPSEGASGIRPDGTATATCLCGTVQLSFPVEGDDMVTAFVCHCADCHKISSSMFCSNFIIANRSLRHVRGEDKLTRYAQNRTIASGAYMQDSFCSVCGNLMYRRSSRFPGVSVLRVGTVDDFELHATKLKPQFECFTRDRVLWLDSVKIDGISRTDANLYTPTRFSLSRLTHYRLMAWQTLRCAHPYGQQLEWLRKLDFPRAGFVTCSHVLHMNILTALSKTLTQPDGHDDGKIQPESRLDWAMGPAQEMLELTATAEKWAAEMSRAWNAKEVDAKVPVPEQGVDGDPSFPVPHFPYPSHITYDDIWLAYMWNFYAASQIILRESLIEVLLYICDLQHGTTPDDMVPMVSKQRAWVDVLSASILKSLPQLLGFASSHDEISSKRQHDQQQGVMAGRLFALFSMWVVERAKFASAEHKDTAVAVIRWMNSRHELD